MTAQISDSFTYRGEDHSLVGIKGKGRLYDPTEHGIRCVMIHTACWRGYIAEYAVADGELRLAKLTMRVAPETPRPVTVLGVAPTSDVDGRLDFGAIDRRFPFTGSLRLGKDFIQELYVHMGFHPAWKFRVVHELTFEDGRLVREVDCSKAMEKIRARLRVKPLGPDGTSDAEVMKWIELAFDQGYL